MGNCFGKLFGTDQEVTKYEKVRTRSEDSRQYPYCDAEDENSVRRPSGQDDIQYVINENAIQHETVATVHTPITNSHQSQNSTCTTIQADPAISVDSSPVDTAHTDVTSDNTLLIEPINASQSKVTIYSRSEL